MQTDVLRSLPEYLPVINDRINELIYPTKATKEILEKIKHKGLPIQLVSFAEYRRIVANIQNSERGSLDQWAFTCGGEKHVAAGLTITTNERLI